LIAGASRAWATVPVLPAAPAHGGDESQDDGMPAGLLADYSSGAGGQAVRRVDADVQFNWADASPDLRVAAEEFEVRWRGKLFVPAGGRYRFHFFLSGTARLDIANKVAVGIHLAVGRH
jgi:hypothetical protein